MPKIIQIETHANEIVFRLTHIHPKAYRKEIEWIISTSEALLDVSPFNSKAYNCLSVAITGNISFSMDVGRNFSEKKNQCHRSRDPELVFPLLQYD